MPNPDPVYREWIRARPCVLRGVPDHTCMGDIQACHYKTRRHNPDHGNLFPACANAHMEQHQHGIKTFQTTHHLNLALVCRILWTVYERDYRADLEATPRW